MIVNDLSHDEMLLDTEEKAFVTSSVKEKERLIFSIVMKFFQKHGYFFTDFSSVGKDFISILAKQLNIYPHINRTFDLKSEKAKKFRHKIRAFYGYQKATEKDIESLISWLMTNVLHHMPTLPQCKQKALLFFKERKIEPFATLKLDRYINTARQRFEQELFSRIFNNLPKNTKTIFDQLLGLSDDEEVSGNAKISEKESILLKDLKRQSIGTSLQIAETEALKLNKLHNIVLPYAILNALPRKTIRKYYQRVMADLPGNIISREPTVKYAMLAMFCYMRTQIMTDNMVELLIKLILNMHARSESFVKKDIIQEVAKNNGKFDILMNLASTAAAYPKGIIEDVIYPMVPQETLIALTKELMSDKRGRWYQQKVQVHMRLLYSSSHRKSRMAILNILSFHNHTASTLPILQAINFIKDNQDLNSKYYPDEALVPIKGVVPSSWMNMVVEEDNNKTDSKKDGKTILKVNKINYEVAVFEVLRAKLYCKEIWVDGAYRYRDPKEDEVKDFKENESYYFKLLNLPEDPAVFISTLKQELKDGLASLNKSILNNDRVKIISGTKAKSKIRVSPSEAQQEPHNIKLLKQEMLKRWPGVGLIDLLKEADLRIGFTKHFKSSGDRVILDDSTYLKRLLLALYAIGTNIGIKKCVDASDQGTIYSDLRYIKRRFMNSANAREAITDILNALFLVRDASIWGEPSTGCACDSTHVETWDHNMMSSFHPRYKKDGAMIYWHVDKKAACVYSQFKNCTSSEVASMIMGFLWHGTNMDMKQCYMDTHGQSLLAFAFSRLLHLDLLPRIKGIDKETLYCFSSDSKDNYKNLTDILGKSLDEKIIYEQYKEIVRYTASLRTGTIEPEVIVRQFGKDNEQSPTYKALMEIGKAVKTIFICQYLQEEALRIEIDEALNVVERVNGVVNFIFYGKLSTLNSHQQEEQELSVVCLHLLEICMVYINTLMIQQILSEPEWKNRLTPEDKRALSPLILTHINPYGLLILNLEERIVIETYSTQEKTHDFSRAHTRQAKSKRIGETA